MVIVIEDYNPLWPNEFASLATTVRAALGSVLVRIEHIGSTAVPNLPAKPIIDLDAVVSIDQVSEAIKRLQANGYIHKGDQGVVGREAFRCPGGTVLHHLYVCSISSPELAAHVKFRDALRANSELATTYGRLKRELAARFGTDRAGYCEAKTEFVKSVLALQIKPQ